jgi:hypothetical protein
MEGNDGLTPGLDQTDKMDEVEMRRISLMNMNGVV